MTVPEVRRWDWIFYAATIAAEERTRTGQERTLVVMVGSRPNNPVLMGAEAMAFVNLLSQDPEEPTAGHWLAVVRKPGGLTTDKALGEQIWSSVDSDEWEPLGLETICTIVDPPEPSGTQKVLVFEHGQINAHYVLGRE